MSKFISYVVNAILLGTWDFFFGLLEELRRKTYSKKNKKRLETAKKPIKTKEDKLDSAKAIEDIISDR